MSKHKAPQRYVLKIDSSELKKSRWNFNVTLKEARQHDWLIALADSQMLRWIDELNDNQDADERAMEIRKKQKRLRNEETTVETRKEMKRLCNELDSIQFKPDYVCVVMDKVKNYDRCVKGFKINGIKYVRLVSTNGGVKNKTIVFTSERLAPELKRRIENGRNVEKELVPAKLEAYRGLTCSASIPVSFPDGIIVVNDAFTKFKEDIIYLDDADTVEPRMIYKDGEDLENDISDGCGMMLPSLAEKWSAELGLNYMVSGVNTRFAWEKGMVFTFDFVEFAEKVAGSYEVTDVWGHKRDVRDAELILTESQVKLWDSYSSCEEYVETSLNNHYTFCVTKESPKRLESSRTLNYQFIQSYDLTDEQIDELIAPTVNTIKEVINGDIWKAILYLKGTDLNERNVKRLENDFVKGMMIDERVYDDPFVRRSIYNMIRHRIDRAKIGVLDVHGNYSIISGDLYALCQNMFGIEITGLLKKGEIYNHYWCGTDYVATFRAPMSCHNNICKMHPNNTDDAKYWYRYMNTVTVLNAWDSTPNSLNGADFDGDQVMLTDNKVLVENIRDTRSIYCIQRKAQKKIPTEADIIETNKASFGNRIGVITNHVTSFFDTKARYDRDSEEYKTLEYRIACGQLYQQNEIDSCKGVVTTEMPKWWYEFRGQRDALEVLPSMYSTIVSDRKPYFMMYIYPDVKREYTKFIEQVNKDCRFDFDVSMDELMAIPKEDLTEDQEKFLFYVNKMNPVGTDLCVMNQICWKVEDAFNGYVYKANKSKEFNYKFMLSGCGYTDYDYQKIKGIYKRYAERVSEEQRAKSRYRVDEGTLVERRNATYQGFVQECWNACPNADELLDIVLDLCYPTNNSKQFAWDMCGGRIVFNMLKNHDYTIRVPVKSENGDFTYAGDIFCVEDVFLDCEEIVSWNTY